MALADDLRAGPVSQAPVPRILTLDIERLQGTATVWDQGKQYVGWKQFEREPRTIGVALKWLGEAPVWVDERRGRDHMLRYVHYEMSRATAICTYNGVRFDMPILAQDMAKAGLPKVRPFKNIDLYQVVRRNFKLLSNSLAYTLKFFELGGKMTTPPGLWDRCAAGDVEAWRTMGQYARQDCKETEKLLMFLRPYLPGTAHLALMAGTEKGCPNCGSENLEQDGSVFTTVTKYAASRCADCGTWVRMNYIQDRTLVRAVR